MSLHPRRLTRPASLGTSPVFLTICTWKRQRWFVRRELVELVEVLFLQSCAARRFQLIAYCFMPDHLHGLVAGTSETSDVNSLVRTAKQITGFKASQSFGLRLWQPSYFDRTLRAEEGLTSAIRYIVDNPVRAKLASSPAEYPYWGSQVYSKEEILEFASSVPRG